MKISNQEIRDLVSQGKNPREIAQQYQMNISTVYYRLQKLNLHVETSAPQNPGPQFNAVVVKTEDVVKLQSEIDLNALIPQVDKNYKTRDIDSVIKKYADRNQDPVVLVGESSTGKNYSLQNYCANAGLPFIVVSCDDSSILKEYIGRREIRNGTTYFKSGLLTEALQKPSLILIDEFNCLPASKLFFLHELLNNRRIFIKETDEIIQAHKDCRIFLACNPNTVRYSGTNKTNVALGTRVKIIELEPFSVAEAGDLFDCGDSKLTESLKKFYEECRRVIQEQNLRMIFSLRAVIRIAQSLRYKDSVQDALAHNFYNMALLTASDKERDTIRELARICFGIDTL